MRVSTLLGGGPPKLNECLLVLYLAYSGTGYVMVWIECCWLCLLWLNPPPNCQQMPIPFILIYAYPSTSAYLFAIMFAYVCLCLPPAYVHLFMLMFSYICLCCSCMLMYVYLSAYGL
jgi:hypothetical protein